jgi:hypothetical protein
MVRRSLSLAVIESMLIGEERNFGVFEPAQVSNTSNVPEC